MTIKSKLTLNAIMVLGIIATVVAATVICMGIVKGKLYDLTEKSTPFQTRTMELQRAIHAATADLIKVGSAVNHKELETYRSDSEASLGQVKKAEEAVEALSAGKKMGTYDDLSSQARQLFSVTGERLAIEEGAISANNEVRGKLKDVAGRLQGLDAKVKLLESQNSATYRTSIDKANGAQSRVGEIQQIIWAMKDLEVWCFEMEKVKAKDVLEGLQPDGTVLVSQAKTRTQKVLTGSEERGEKLLGAISDLQKKIGLVATVNGSLFEKTGSGHGETYEATLDDVMASAKVALSLFENEMRQANQGLAMESGQQAGAFFRFGKATTILYGASELTSLGLSTEGLATRLFTVNSAAEIEEVQKSLTDVFSKVDKTAKTLDAILADLGTKDEQKMVSNAVSGMGSMKTLLFAKDGIIVKVRSQLAMKEKAAQVMKGLRETVLHQAEEAKKTMATAKGVQEQSIVEVNAMVRSSTLLVILIGIVAVGIGIGFGAWIYRSISKPLARLIEATDDIAAGNLSREVTETTHDEIGRVEASMAKMVSNLKDIVGKIRSATEALASSSEELSATACSLDQGSEEQNTQVEQAAGAMVEMSQTTEEVSRNASGYLGSGQVDEKDRPRRERNRPCERIRTYTVHRDGQPIL